MPLLMKQVQTAFQPAKEITDPKKFAGRIAEVERGCELLLSRDPMFIYGIPGIGKSSLARQLKLIAEGDVLLLREIGSSLAKESFGFLACYLQCDDSLTSINDLLYRLLIDPDCLRQWYEYSDLPELGTYDRPPDKLNTLLVSEFKARIRKIAGLAKDGLAIFVDEFDRIPHRDGFASLIKAIEPDLKCMFVTVGVAATERDLVKDHASIVRQLDKGRILVPNMADDELKRIIKTAEAEVGGEITFDTDATQELIRLVKGQPYLLQLIGNQALIKAYKTKQELIVSETIHQVLRDIASGRASTVLERQYLEAIGNSPARETVLRIFAEIAQETVSTAEAYPLAQQRGVSNPSYYVGQLRQQQHGAKLEKVGEQFYRISDPLFRAYVAATPRRFPISTREDTPVPTQEISHQTVHIVHISDVHFGSTHYFSNLPLARDTIPESDKPSLEKYLVQDLQAILPTDPVDIMVVSGDFTQRALQEEFDKAKASFKRLLSAVNLPEKNVIMIPGNHDVNWDMRKSDDKNRRAPFLSYIEFCRSFGGSLSLVEPEQLFETRVFPEPIGCLFLALNSAVLEGPDDHRGYLGDTQLDLALKQVHEAAQGSESLVKIAVLHHHLLPVPTIEQDIGKPDEILRDAGRVKSRLMEAGFSLVLHGHRHHGHAEMINDGKNSMVVIGCGSTGVLQAERGSQPLQFNRIHLRPEPSVLSVEIQRMDFDPARSHWLPAADHHPVFTLSRRTMS